jgi:cobalt-zinc-cadmium efflux system outer membrane protein
MRRVAHGLVIFVACAVPFREAGGQAWDVHSGPLTLDAALVRAAERAPAASAALERARGAGAAADAEPRWRNPQLEVRSENWAGGEGLPLDTFVTISQPLELFGQRAARLRLAGADREEALGLASRASRQAVLDVARAYLDTLRLRETARIVGEQRDGLRQIVAALQRRVAEGVAAEADLNKFDVELEQVETAALRVDLDLRFALTALAAGLGFAELAPEQLVEPGPPPPLDVPSENELEAAIDRRPDVEATRLRLERARRLVELERARGRPDLVVTGGYKRTSAQDTGVAGVLLPLPLADRNDAAVARAESDVRAIGFELDGQRRLARAEAAANVMRAQALGARALRAPTALVAPATVARDAARASFREGAFDALRLVDAERVWTDARRTELSLQLEAVLASIEARLALGREVRP